MSVREADELACPECESPISEFEASLDAGDGTHPLTVPFRCPTCHTSLEVVVGSPLSEGSIDVRIDRPGT